MSDLDVTIDLMMELEDIFINDSLLFNNGIVHLKYNNILTTMSTLNFFSDDENGTMIVVPTYKDMEAILTDYYKIGEHLYSDICVIKKNNVGNILNINKIYLCLNSDYDYIMNYLEKTFQSLKRIFIMNANDITKINKKPQAEMVWYEYYNIGKYNSKHIEEIFSKMSTSQLEFITVECYIKDYKNDFITINKFINGNKYNNIDDILTNIDLCSNERKESIQKVLKNIENEDCSICFNKCSDKKIILYSCCQNYTCMNCFLKTADPFTEIYKCYFCREFGYVDDIYNIDFNLPLNIDIEKYIFVKINKGKKILILNETNDKNSLFYNYFLNEKEIEKSKFSTIDKIIDSNHNSVYDLIFIISTKNKFLDYIFETKIKYITRKYKITTKPILIEKI